MGLYNVRNLVLVMLAVVGWAKILKDWTPPIQIVAAALNHWAVWVAAYALAASSAAALALGRARNAKRMEEYFRDQLAEDRDYHEKMMRERYRNLTSGDVEDLRKDLRKAARRVRAALAAHSAGVVQTPVVDTTSRFAVTPETPDAHGRKTE